MAEHDEHSSFIKIKGVKAIPPRGGGADLSNFDLTRAIVYMANQSGGSLREPAEPKK